MRYKERPEGGESERARERKLTQDHDRNGRNVLGVGASLRDNDGDLKGDAPADAAEELVADPFRDARVGVERVQQAGGDDADGGPADLQRHGEPGGADDHAGQDHRHCRRHDQRQVVDARHGGAGTADALEVDRQVVDDEVVGPDEDAGEAAADGDGAPRCQSRHDDGALTLAPLPHDKGGGDQHETNQKTDYEGATPRRRLAAVLQRQHEGDDGAHDERDADGVHLQQLFALGGGDGPRGRRRVEEEQDDGGRQPADGQVDPEAPAPRDAVGEDAADQRADDASDAERHADEARVGGAALRLGDEGDDGVGAGADASGAEPVDGAADDEDGRARRRRADETAELEHANGCQERRLEREVAVRLAPRRLEAAVSHEEGGAVPRHLVQPVKLVRDLGDGRCDYCLTSC